MNEDFRKRAFLPLAIPLGILVVVGLGILLYWWLLSYNTREGAAAVAIVAAAGILVAISLATSQDELSRAKKAGVALAAVGPVVIGAVIAGGALDIDPSVLNINAEPKAPELLLPEVDPDAPVLAAVDLTAFCLPTDGGCEDTNEWTIEAAEDFAEVFTYTFENRHAGVDHNLALYGLPEESAFGSGVDQLGTESLTPEVPAVFAGVETRSYEFEWGGGEEGVEAEPVTEFYFVCTVHPSTMWGVGTVEGA